MESLSWEVYLLYFMFSICFPLIIYTLFFSKGPLNLPPGSNGLPIVGETIHFGISGPNKFISDRMKKHSTQVFRTSMLGEKVAVLCGSTGNKFVFNNQSNILSFSIPPILKKIIGIENDFLDRISNSPGPSKHLSQAFLAMLKTDKLKEFIPMFNETGRYHVKKEWKDGREVKVFPLSKLFCFTLASRFLMGNLDIDEIKTLAGLFDDVKSGFFSMPIDLPGTTYRRAINAGKLLHDRVSKIIQWRRKELQESENGQGLDLISQVLKVAPSDTNEEFQYTSDLRSIIVGTLLAATSSPASAITFTLKYLTEMPHIHNLVYQEQMEIAMSKGEENDIISWDDLKKMEYTWNVVREVLRVTTPLTLGGFRDVNSDFTYAGYTIPKGWKILWTSHTSHKDPKYFENPEEFNPSRFESNILEPYSYVPFGGGRGICPGRDLFKLYMLTFIHIIVTKFKLEKLDPNEGIKYEMTPVPVNGFPVRLIHR